MRQLVTGEKIDMYSIGEVVHCYARSAMPVWRNATAGEIGRYSDQLRDAMPLSAVEVASESGFVEGEGVIVEKEGCLSVMFKLGNSYVVDRFTCGRTSTLNCGVPEQSISGVTATAEAGTISGVTATAATKRTRVGQAAGAEVPAISGVTATRDGDASISGVTATKD